MNKKYGDVCLVRAAHFDDFSESYKACMEASENKDLPGTTPRPLRQSSERASFFSYMNIAFEMPPDFSHSVLDENGIFGRQGSDLPGFMMHKISQIESKRVGVIRRKRT
ncbi:hypothetical protein BT96DRAFT_1020074 [Gymnopus androsaceus JB14]|uniref:Uncharacterized protein n=1 Tax=Gymnopus androsaceus JB14 TaxID=1447944 RepID=A0A6A4HNC1_9AGAR|nr:hypothetical protein BT96DRAFT_1020074 [Gymnopus androsaceus JB14]